jgi:hypothetical protein
VDHHFADEGHFVRRERRPLDLGTRLLRDRIGRRHADGLAGLDPVAGADALAVDPDLPGPRPARHDIEARVRQVALEPAIEPDAVVIGADGELTDFGLTHARACRSVHITLPASHSPPRSP